MLVGNIKFAAFKGLTELPQKAASAWAKIAELQGGKYTVIAYAGEQLVHGVNHWFIVGVETIAVNPERRIVTMAVNECDGKYTHVAGSDMTIFE